MRHLDLHRFRRAIGKLSFGIFFPNENKRLLQRHGKNPQPDLVLVTVPSGKQTAAVSVLRDITGWTVKKATSFVKEGDYPKVIYYNINSNPSITVAIDAAKDEHGIIIEIF